MGRILWLHPGDGTGGRSEKYLLFTASLRADNGKLVFRMSDGHGLSCFGTREATFTQIADTSSAHTEPWFDYLEKPEEMNWDGNLEIELPEYPGVTFRWYPEEMEAVTENEVMQLYTGMPIWNTYFSDLTGDGLPELCSTLSFGSGMIDSRIIVYDYANGTSYMLEDRGKYDYSLRLNETDGCLWVVKKAYNSDDIVASGKLLFADNCLQVAYDLKTNCESTPNTETSTSETENTLRTSDTVELIGYVGNSQTSWIELYESTDNKEPIATVPYDLIAALPGCDRKSEAFTFGYLDSITFYYGKIGAFCWCVAALPPAAGTGAANVCTSPDSGETWDISDPNALYTGTVSALALRLKWSALSATATSLTTAPKSRGRWTAAKHGRGWNWIFRKNTRSTICSRRIQRFPAMTAAIRSYCSIRTETTAP